MSDFGYLCLGLFGLWVGTEMSVTSAARIAERFGWSQVFVGMTLLAFGTDLPELVVAISGAVNSLHGNDSSGLVMGNAVGSNIFDCLVPVGAAALIAPVLTDRVTVLFDLPYLILVTGVFLILLKRGSGLGRWEGILLTLFYLVNAGVKIKAW
jgi:cation:H+ antiporter